MQNMGDYHGHYLKKDVLLLADFEKVIETCLKFYRLEPCHYFNFAGLSWDATLKLTLFIEKELRGRISYIAKR